MKHKLVLVYIICNVVNKGKVCYHRKLTTLLMYILENNGPRMDPWGTPEMAKKDLERKLSRIWMQRIYSVKFYDLICRIRKEQGTRTKLN